MKALSLILAIGIAGCAQMPQSLTLTDESRPMAASYALSLGRDCPSLQVLGGLSVCRQDGAALQAAGAAEVPALIPERGQEIIGDEAHYRVLDGIS